MKQKKIVQIILGAGRPFSGDQNASLKEVSNENFLPYLKNADALIIRTQNLKKNHIGMT